MVEKEKRRRHFSRLMSISATVREYSTSLSTAFYLLLLCKSRQLRALSEKCDDSFVFRKSNLSRSVSVGVSCLRLVWADQHILSIDSYQNNMTNSPH